MMFSVSIPASTTSGNFARHYLVLCYSVLKAGALGKAAGPAVWSIAEVNLGERLFLLFLPPCAHQDDSQHSKQVYATQEHKTTWCNKHEMEE